MSGEPVENIFMPASRAPPRMAAVLAWAFVALLLPLGALAAAPVAPEPLPLGTFALLPEPPRPCLPDDASPLGAFSRFTCLRFTVDCASAGAPARGDLALAPPLGPPQGTLVFHGGGEGAHFWSSSNPAVMAFVTEFQQRGFAVAQLRWDQPWALPPEGVEAGHAGTTCRPLTAVRWVHDHVHALLPPPAPSPATTGACGFCLIGWSHGSVLSAYSLSHYGLDQVLDAVVLEAGPGRVDQERGCLAEDDAGERHGTDHTFGIRTFDGPCFRRDASWASTWRADSILTGGNDFHHPATRVEFVYGTLDRGDGPAGAERYAGKLAAEGQQLLRVQVVPGTPHNVMATPQGVVAMRKALLGDA